MRTLQVFNTLQLFNTRVGIVYTCQFDLVINPCDKNMQKFFKNCIDNTHSLCFFPHSTLLWRQTLKVKIKLLSHILLIFSHRGSTEMNILSLLLASLLEDNVFVTIMITLCCGTLHFLCPGFWLTCRVLVAQLMNQIIVYDPQFIDYSLRQSNHKNIKSLVR